MIVRTFSLCGSSYSPISKGDVATEPPSRTPVLMVIGPPLSVLKDCVDFCRCLFAEVHQLAFLSNIRGFASYRSH